MPPLKLRQKQTPKQNRVIETLRKEILGGTLRPQTKLPSQIEIAQRFKVSSVTAHMAVARLAREGFLYSRKRHGTFVTEKPPHLNNYALVFWNDPAAYQGRQWSRYYTALTEEAIRIQQCEGRRMLLFHGIDQHVDSDDRQRLMSYIESKRLGGIIFANSPQLLTGTPILEQPGIARVALMSQCAFDMPAVASDYVMWFTKAFDYLVSQGRKRIAVIMIGTYRTTDELLTELTKPRGITMPSRWRHTVSSGNFQAARNLIELLMHNRPEERPDGLIIADDNLVEHCMAGLVLAGVRVPDDVAVVAHCSFPYPPPSVLPVKRLGYDIGEMLRTCIDVIDRQRRGETVPRETVLPALFEEELVERQASVPAHAAAVS